MQFLDFRKVLHYSGGGGWTKPEQVGHSSSNVARQLQNVADQIIRAALKLGTRNSHQHHWDCLVQFVQDILEVPFVLPLDTHMVIMFLSYLFDQGKRYSTLLNYLAGINHNLKMRGMPDCSSSFMGEFEDIFYLW